jgi:hypothetical protein
MALNALREWKLACPRRLTDVKDSEGNPVKELHYVFPTGTGNIESRSNITKRGFLPTQVRAGVAVASAQKDDNGKIIMVGKYGGMHALRHFHHGQSTGRRMAGSAFRRKSYRNAWDIAPL